MNVLLDKLPTVAEIDGEEYELNTDFRNCLNIILAFEDPELTLREKYAVMLELLYKDAPENTQKALELALLFLSCGEVDEEEPADTERVFSFEKDSRYIYSAVQQTHNVDLNNVGYLHWWKFCYMFNDLSENCFFTKLVDLRSRKNKGKLTKEEREYCTKIHKIIELPKVETQEEKIAKNKFMELLNG